MPTSWGVVPPPYLWSLAPNPEEYRTKHIWGSSHLCYILKGEVWSLKHLSEQNTEQEKQSWLQKVVYICQSILLILSLNIKQSRCMCPRGLDWGWGIVLGTNVPYNWRHGWRSKIYSNSSKHFGTWIIPHTTPKKKLEDLWLKQIRKHSDSSKGLWKLSLFVSSSWRRKEIFSMSMHLEL